MAQGQKQADCRLGTGWVRERVVRERERFGFGLKGASNFLRERLASIERAGPAGGRRRASRLPRSGPAGQPGNVAKSHDLFPVSLPPKHEGG